MLRMIFVSLYLYRVCTLTILFCRCFLLTPKLLPDLEYSEACSILNIMNGPWIEQPSKGIVLEIQNYLAFFLTLIPLLSIHNILNVGIQCGAMEIAGGLSLVYWEKANAKITKPRLFRSASSKIHQKQTACV